MITRPAFTTLRHGSAALALAVLSSTASATEWKFDFGSKQPAPGFTSVAPDTSFDPKRGFGYVGSTPAEAPGKPVIFAINADEGNYDVTVKFGDDGRSTSTAIKAESRRLMVQQVATGAGKYETRSFTVNVRRPAIASGGVTSLNIRELGPPPVPDWDDLLSLEFNGDSTAVASIEIKPANDAVTIFIAGDSTVTDQANGPYAGWAQMLPRFFTQGVAISNQAESGLALFSFEHQKRLEKVLSMMKPGDFFFIQFGHNDQKDKRPDAGPFTTYKANLKHFVEAARQRGGIPVLVTPMERRRIDESGKQTATLADYAEAVRQVGTEEKAPVLDLNALSLKLYAALGPNDSTKAFVHYPANTFPGQEKALKDDTHHSAYGAYELARCVVEEIKAHVPALAKRLTPDAGTFNAEKPDRVEDLILPISPLRAKVEKPAGN